MVLDESVNSPEVLSIENCTEMFGNVSTATTEFNVTCLKHAPVLTHQALVRSIVLAGMSLSSLVANLAAIAAISKDKNRTSLCDMILHLSIADLFVSLFCLAGESIWTYTVSWNAGNFMCKTVKYWQMFGLYLSTYLVVVIGLDRWVAISNPLKRTQVGKGRAKVWTAIAWLLSALFSVPQLFIFRVSKGPFIEDFYQCVTYGFYTAKWQEQLYSILSLLLMFVVPLLILIVTYSSTIINLRESERCFQAAGENSNLSQIESRRQKRMRTATRRSLKMSLFIVGGFILCWIPYYLLDISLLFGLTPEKFGQKLIQNIFFFGMSNSLINPLIYGAFHLWRQRPKNIENKSQHNKSINIRSNNSKSTNKSNYSINYPRQQNNLRRKRLPNDGIPKFNSNEVSNVDGKIVGNINNLLTRRKTSDDSTLIATTENEYLSHSQQNPIQSSNNKSKYLFRRESLEDSSSEFEKAQILGKEKTTGVKKVGNSSLRILHQT